MAFAVNWNQFGYELYRAYGLDRLYSSVTDFQSPQIGVPQIGVPSKKILLLSCIPLYLIAKTIYNIYFHPLSKFPGPVLAKATKIPVALLSWEGSVSQWLSELHNYYQSDVVRIGPDELSFIDPSAWKDIYGLRKGHAAFPKDLSAFPEVNSIVTANDADHSRYRRLLGHAFSDKALREQEPLLQGYVDSLISGLKKQAETEGKANLVDWFNWIAFDIIVDLSFGESFDCLKESAYHPWVAMLMSGLKAISLLHVTTKFPPLERLLRLYVPKKEAQAREDHMRLSKEKVEQRLKADTTRPDFVAYTLRHNDEKAGMTKDEIWHNMATIVGAGGDTTATFLSGAIWCLLSNPHCYDQIIEEVRGRFRRAEDIKLKAIIEDLPYFQAIVDEVSRIYPPALAAQPRLAPTGGATVSGHWVPEGTQLKLNQYAAYHSSLNFNSPEAFAPSRWLGNEHFKDDKRDVVEPFSVGTRNCIGKNLALAEIRLILANVLWHFDMELAEETDEEWMKQKAWMVWERKPLYVKLKERKL